MKYLITLILLFNVALFSTLFAQTDTLEGKGFVELSKILNQHLRDTTTSIPLSKYYIKKAQTEGELIREAEGLHAIAGIYYTSQNSVLAAKAMDELIEFVEQNKLTSFETRTYEIAGVIYLMSAKVKKAVDATNKLIQIAEKTENEALKDRALELLEFMNSMGGNNETFITNHKQKLKELETNPPTEISDSLLQFEKMRVEYLLGDAYIKVKNGDSSSYYFRRALQKSLAYKDTCTTKMLYLFLGASEILTNSYSDAKKSLDYSQKYCRPFTKLDSLLIGTSYAKLDYKQGNFKKAIKTLEKTLDDFEVTTSGEAFMDDTYMVLADSYKEIGDFEKANFYFEKHVNTTTQFGEVQDSIETNVRKIELDNFQNELAQLKKEKETRTNYLILVLLGASLVIIVLLFYLLKFYRNKKQNEIKFEALLQKINAASTPSEIIDTKDEVLEEKTTNDVSEEVTKQILDGLKKLEAKEYFLKQECNSYNVAKKINTNTSYLSKVINSHYGKNFNTYINDLRINYAIVRIKNDVFFRSFSIQAIAEEVGYKSADSFSKYFKKDTGLNPSFYIKNIKNMD